MVEVEICAVPAKKKNASKCTRFELVALTQIDRNSIVWGIWNMWKKIHLYLWPKLQSIELSQEFILCEYFIFFFTAFSQSFTYLIRYWSIPTDFIILSHSRFFFEHTFTLTTLIHSNFITIIKFKVNVFFKLETSYNIQNWCFFF